MNPSPSPHPPMAGVGPHPTPLETPVVFTKRDKKRVATLVKWVAAAVPLLAGGGTASHFIVKAHADERVAVLEYRVNEMSDQLKALEKQQSDDTDRILKAIEAKP